jgi:hypothetical protein
MASRVCTSFGSPNLRVVVSDPKIQSVSGTVSTPGIIPLQRHGKGLNGDKSFSIN